MTCMLSKSLKTIKSTDTKISSPATCKSLPIGDILFLHLGLEVQTCPHTGRANLLHLCKLFGYARTFLHFFMHFRHFLHIFLLLHIFKKK